MNKTNLVTSLLGAAAIALLSQGAYAQDPSAPKTRAEVKAEAKTKSPSTMNSSAEGSGSSPGRAMSGTTRAEVKSDKTRTTAIENSSAQGSGSSPMRTPATKTRAEVKSENAGAKVPAGDKLPGQK